MVVQIFKPLENVGETFQSNKLGDTVATTSFTIFQRFLDTGNFTMIIPVGALFVDKIVEDTLLFVDYQYWVIVKDVVIDMSVGQGQYSITGTDLKGLLLDRITLHGEEQDTGTQGYDVVQGSSETVAKHYVNNNLVNPEDPNRKTVGLVIAPDQQRGIANDTYMSRFEVVAEVEKKVCKNAKLGYDITVDLASSTLIFDVIEPVNKTVNQNERNRVVFDVERGNVATLVYEHGIGSSKNAFYATKSGGGLAAEALTQLVTRPEEETPKGIHRREMHMNVSASSTAGEEISDITELALKQATDYEPTNSFELQIKGPEDFGVIYNLGDFVTVRNRQLGVTLDTQITEAQITISSAGKSLALTYGEKKAKPLTQINRKINNQKI